MRRKPMFSDLDPWFEERGYKRAGRKSRWKKTLPRRIELQVEAEAIPRGETEPMTSIAQRVRLPQYAKLLRSAMAGSTLNGDPGSDIAFVLKPWDLSANHFLKPDDLSADRPLEIDGSGPKWDAFLETIGPVFEANEAQLLENTDDLRPVMEGPYFSLAYDLYAELILILHAGDFNAARNWIDDLDYKAVLDPYNLTLPPGSMTAEEEYQQARRVFHDYIDTQGAEN